MTGRPRAYRYPAYSPDDPPEIVRCNREDYSRRCAALHDAMWSLAERVGAEEYKLTAQDALWLLQDRPTPEQVRAR